MVGSPTSRKKIRVFGMPNLSSPQERVPKNECGSVSITKKPVENSEKENFQFVRFSAKSKVKSPKNEEKENGSPEKMGILKPDA